MKYIFFFILLPCFCNLHSQTMVYDTLITGGDDYTIDDAVEDYQNNTTFVGLKGKWSGWTTVYYGTYLMKLSPSGNLLTYKEFPTLTSLAGCNLSVGATGSPSIIFIPPNQYLLVTTNIETDSVHSQLVFSLLDSNLNVLQSYEQGIIGKSERFLSILKDNQGDFIVAFVHECGASPNYYQTVINKYDSQFSLKNTLELPDCVSFDCRNSFSKQGILEKTNHKGYYIFRNNYVNNGLSNPVQQMWSLDQNLQNPTFDTLYNPLTTFTKHRPNICASWIDKQKQVIVSSKGGSTVNGDITYMIRDTSGTVFYQDTVYYATSEVTATSAIANRLNHDFYLGFTTNFDGTFGSNELSKYMLLKIDEFGNKKWRATYGDSAGQYVMYKTLATFDGGVIMAGTRIMDDRPWVDTVKHGIYIVKIMDNSLKINAPIFTESMYTLFPNPADNKLNISLFENIHAQIELFDLQGRKLIEKDFLKEAEIEIKGLSKGLYMYRIIDEKGRSVSGKWEKR